MFQENPHAKQFAIQDIISFAKPLGSSPRASFEVSAELIAHGVIKYLTSTEYKDYKAYEIGISSVWNIIYYCMPPDYQEVTKGRYREEHGLDAQEYVSAKVVYKDFLYRLTRQLTLLLNEDTIVMDGLEVFSYAPQGHIREIA